MRNRGFNIWEWLKKYLLFLIRKILQVRGYEVITKAGVAPALL